MPETITRGRDKFKKYRRLIMLLVYLFSLHSFKTRKKKLEKYRNTRGYIGCAIRYALLKTICKECGENIYIATGVYILNAQNLKLGNNISIHPMCYIECGMNENTYVSIGNDVSIAHGATIICTSHTYNDSKEKNIKDMPVKSRPIQICDNVWIGAKATILYGVTIASGCVIGANSVVSKDTESDGIYIGAPAKRIKNRI